MVKKLVAKLIESSKSIYDEEEKNDIIPQVGNYHDGNANLYMAHKIAKLKELQQINEKEIKSNIFKGCIMFINGYTNPPIEELRRLIQVHGGETIAYRAIKITHFVCNNFTDAQLKSEYSRIKLNERNKIYNVTSNWILDSINNNRRLDENLYLPVGLSNRYGNDISKLFKANTNDKLINQSSSITKDDKDDVIINSYDDITKHNEIETIPNYSNITDNLNNNNQNNNQITYDIDLTNEYDNNIIDNNYTFSQEEFLNSLPIEMRDEVRDQMIQLKQSSTNLCIQNNDLHEINLNNKHLQINRDIIKNSTVISDLSYDNNSKSFITDDNLYHGSNSNILINNYNNKDITNTNNNNTIMNNNNNSDNIIINNLDKIDSYHDNDEIISIHEDIQQIKTLRRKENLESMIHCIHYSNHKVNNTKSIQIFMKNYIEILISCDSYTTNIYNKNQLNALQIDHCNDDIVLNDNTVNIIYNSPSKTLYHLLIDYGTWLIHNHQYEQVSFLLNLIMKSSIIVANEIYNSTIENKTYIGNKRYFNDDNNFNDISMNNISIQWKTFPNQIKIILNKILKQQTGAIFK